eukprot:scaffold112990_cov32-Prasinocladus_malaysianus.AAC.1
MSSGMKVGFIGLGAMGSGMARVLVGAGFQVKGYDVWKPALEKFIEAGGTAAPEPKDAAEGANALVSAEIC